MPILTHPPLFRLMEHLEFEQNRKWLRAHPLKVTGDILLVAGDTAYLDLPDSGCDTYSQYSFWDWASEHYRQVIVCLGNHDFYRIKYNGHRLTSNDFNNEHERCLSFVKRAVAESKAQTKIVLSHHVPTQLCTAKEFRGSTINGAFTVELGDYIADSGIEYWIYGHSHRNIDAEKEYQMGDVDAEQLRDFLESIQ